MTQMQCNPNFPPRCASPQARDSTGVYSRARGLIHASSRGALHRYPRDTVVMGGEEGGSSRRWFPKGSQSSGRGGIR